MRSAEGQQRRDLAPYDGLHRVERPGWSGGNERSGCTLEDYLQEALVERLSPQTHKTAGVGETKVG